MVYKFFDKKRGLLVSLNGQLAEDLHKPVIKKLKKEKPMRDLKAIFEQQIYQKWNHYLQRIKILNIYSVWQMVSLKMHG